MPSGSRNRRAALAIGLATTALVAAGWWVGLFDPAERLVYDALFRATAPVDRIDDTGLITHIDIDDASLEEVGRWPWPRQRLADVVTELDALGARQVVLDIIMPEPQTPRLRDNPYSKHYDLVGRDTILASGGASGDADARFIHDDRGLARALAEHGPVTLSMHFETEDRLRAPGSLDPDALQRDIEGLVTTRPDMPAGDVLRVVHPSAAAVAESQERDQVLNILRQTQAMRHVRRYALEADAISLDDIPRAARAVAPIPTLAEQADGLGFVYFQPDADGAMRRIPLLMRYEGEVYPQLALLQAARLMGVELGEIRATDDEIVLPDAELPGGQRRDLHIPLEDGDLLINWRFQPGGDWKSSFRHVAIRGLTTIAKNRRLIRGNEYRLLYASAVAVELGLPPDDARRGEYIDLANFALKLMDTRRRAGKLDEMVQSQLDGVLAELGDGEMKAAADSARARIPAIRDSGQLDAGTLSLLDELAGPMLEPDRVRAENRELAAVIVSQQEALRPFVAGKVCFVGSTATGAADFVPTLISARCPGVVVHSNILNTLLAGDFIRVAPHGVNLLAILICGLVASLFASTAGPRMTVVLVFATMIAIAALNGLVAFASLGVWMVLAAPLAAVLLSAFFIAAYRQLTEERGRRFVTRALGSYTSPAVARRIAEHPDLLALAGETREISCFFSDLKGFTPISEAIGSERTVALLNRYLDRMSEALLRHEATINKFIGDAVFAFFNAPDVQEDHARRAVLSALDCRDALARFIEADDSPDVKLLAMRIGIATGQATVGNCGSTRKFDYTAIGNTVNLAARLEPANKVFGTEIMVAGSTVAELPDGEFLLRPLGRLIVVGQQQMADIYELVDRAADASDADRAWAGRWAEAIAHYQTRDFRKAAELFEALRIERPDDRAAGVYLEQIETLRGQDPGDDWRGAIELTTK